MTEREIEKIDKGSNILVWLYTGLDDVCRQEMIDLLTTFTGEQFEICMFYKNKPRLIRIILPISENWIQVIGESMSQFTFISVVPTKEENKTLFSETYSGGGCAIKPLLRAEHYIRWLKEEDI